MKRKPNREHTEQLNVRTSVEQMDALRAYAKQCDIDVSKLVRLTMAWATGSRSTRPTP